MNYQGHFQEPSFIAKKQDQNSFDFMRTEAGSQSMSNHYHSSPTAATDIRSPYSNPIGTFSRPRQNANTSQSLNHDFYSETPSFDGITKYSNKIPGSDGAFHSSRVQAPRSIMPERREENYNTLENIRAHCNVSRDDQKEKLVSNLSSDANVAILPGYSNSGRNSRFPRALGSISSAPQFGPIAQEPLLPVERPPSAVARAQAAIGLTKEHVRNAQNLLSSKGNNNFNRSKKSNPWVNSFGDQDPLMAKRSKQATYRNDLLKQIEQARNRKQVEKFEHRNGVQEHPLGPGYSVQSPYSTHNNEIKVESFVPYQYPQKELAPQKAVQQNNSTPRNEIIGKAVPAKLPTRRHFTQNEMNSTHPQQFNRSTYQQHPPGMFGPPPNQVPMPNQFYPPPPFFYPPYGYPFPPNQHNLQQQFPSFPPYQMPPPPVPLPPPLFQQPESMMNNFNRNPVYQQDPKMTTTRTIPTTNMNDSRKNILKEPALDDLDVELDESVFRHHVWQTSDQLPDPDLKTAAYKTELRKQIVMNRRRKEEILMKEQEEDEKLEQKIEEYQRKMEMQVREEREQATILLREKRSNGSLGIKVNHDHIVVGKGSFNNFLDEDQNSPTIPPTQQPQKLVSVPLKSKGNIKANQPDEITSTTNGSNEDNLEHSKAIISSEKTSTVSLQSTPFDSKVSEATSQCTLFDSKVSEVSMQPSGFESKVSETSLQPLVSDSKVSEASLQTALYDSKVSEASLQTTVYGSKVSEASLQTTHYESNVSGASLLSTVSNSEATLQSTVDASKVSETSLQSKMFDSNCSEASILSNPYDSKVSEVSLQSKTFESNASKASVQSSVYGSSVSEVSLQLTEADQGNTTVCSTICRNSMMTLQSKYSDDSVNSTIEPEFEEKLSSRSTKIYSDVPSELNVQEKSSGSSVEERKIAESVETSNESHSTSSYAEASTAVRKRNAPKHYFIGDTENQLSSEKPTRVPTPFFPKKKYYRNKNMPWLKVTGGGDKCIYNKNIDRIRADKKIEKLEITYSAQQEPDLIVKCSTIKPADKKSNSTCLLQIQKYLELEASRVEKLLSKYHAKRMASKESKRIQQGVKKRMELFNRMIRQITSA